MAAKDKILFRVGTQANLNTILANQSHDVGTFYLTSDTDRLYIGQASGLKLLNKAVMTVASMSELNTMTAGWGSNASVHKDDIAYISGENVLAYFNGSSWTQINPDTVSTVTGLTAGVSTATDGATVSTVLTQTEGGTKTATFTVTGKNGTKVTNSSSTNVEITGDTYTLTSDVISGTAMLTLSSALGQASSVIDIAAGNNVAITGSGSIITIAATDTVLTGNALSIDNAGTLTSAVTDSKSVKSATVQLGYTVGGEFVGIGGAGTSNAVELPVYTKTEIENKFKNLNGLTYCGTLGSNSSDYKLNASYKINNLDVHNGDLFLVSGECTYNSAGDVALTGDLLIATGTENDSGVLESITWTFVPSGDDTTIDTQYQWAVDAASKSYSVTATPGGIKHTSAIIEGTGINVAVATNTTKNQFNATISHADVECDKITDSIDLSQGSPNFEVPAISEITVNDQGHVTATKTTTYKLVKYQAATPAIATEGTNGLKFTANIIANGASTPNATQSFVIKSDTLKLAYSGGVIEAELLWGEF